MSKHGQRINKNDLTDGLRSPSTILEKQGRTLCSLHGKNKKRKSTIRFTIRKNKSKLKVFFFKRQYS